MRLEVTAITNSEALVSLLGFFNHLNGLFQVTRHRLLAADVLARFEGAHHKFVVGARRGDDVDDVDVGIVGDLLEVLVVVNLVLWNTVLRAVHLPFLRRTGDEGDQATVLTVLEVRHDVSGGVTAETEDGPTDGFVLPEVAKCGGS